MCDVYSQLSLTLAAAYSPDCDWRLFSVPVDEYHSGEIASLTQRKLQYKVYARCCPKISHWWNSEEVPSQIRYHPPAPIQAGVDLPGEIPFPTPALVHALRATMGTQRVCRLRMLLLYSFF
jgi:hypothetical protein